MTSEPDFPLLISFMIACISLVEPLATRDIIQVRALRDSRREDSPDCPEDRSFRESADLSFRESEDLFLVVLRAALALEEPPELESERGW